MRRVRAGMVGFLLLCLCAGLSRAANEFKGSTCVPMANCGNCLTDIMPDATFCPNNAKKRCIVSKGDPGTVTFEMCVDTDNGSQTCTITSSKDPKITTCKIKVWFCTTCLDANNVCDYVACSCSGMNDSKGESDVFTNDCT